ncbi:unannotated protein [freshwater metagenome]|uniref:Unannotated protein n=1 Tax=freshwater metagenome TaxID=449393 RepID=A0A6J6BYJ8_9ZZZZ
MELPDDDWLPTCAGSPFDAVSRGAVVEAGLAEGAASSTATSGVLVSMPPATKLKAPTPTAVARAAVPAHTTTRTHFDMPYLYRVLGQKHPWIAIRAA